MVLRTNVKLNFGLNVMRKRPDGYHDIETLFVPCHDFGDTLEVIAGDDYSRTSASLFARYGQPFDGLGGELVEPQLPEGLSSHGKVHSRFAAAEYCLRLAAPPEGHDCLVQGISEDGKLMITIARKEGVDWDPLKDLCARAYAILDEDFDLPPVKIFLEKEAPVGAGLGGGSADAAFTLKALNELFSLGLSDGRLSEYASRLGSDCALFVWNRPMFGTGRGEILEPFDLDLSGYELKVLVPEGITVSTREAYEGIIPRISAEGALGAADHATLGTVRGGTVAVEGENETCSVCDFGGHGGAERSEASVVPKVPSVELKEALRRPIEEWKGLVVNDFEATVFKKHPELAAIKQSLYDSGAVYASMSGSGSSIFAIYIKP